MKNLLISTLIIILFSFTSCGEDDEPKKDKVPPEKDSIETSEGISDSIGFYLAEISDEDWFPIKPIMLKRKDTLSCDFKKVLSPHESDSVLYYIYIIKDKCSGKDSRFVETNTWGSREITDKIADGKRYVGAYKQNENIRILYCEGETGIGCPYEMKTFSGSFSQPRDTLSADTLECYKNQTIFRNASDIEINVKVIILEKCSQGTLDIYINYWDDLFWQSSTRVNQIPSTENIRLSKNTSITLSSRGGNGKIVYRLVIP